MTATPDPYAHGHHESVVRSHGARTAEDSAAYLLARLAGTMTMLDVGCGPGSITLDLAGHVRDIIGVDAVDDVLLVAERARTEADVTNCRFERGDVYDLPFDDDSFDVVHAHQVLQHLTDPLRALREMRRVCRPGGIVACRDADYGAFAWAPPDPLLDRWSELYRDIGRALGAEPDAGRHLLGWAHASGFDDVTPSSSTWTYATPETRRRWCGMWAERVVRSSFAEHAVARRLSDADELATIADGWNRWADHPDGWFVVIHGEIIAVA